MLSKIAIFDFDKTLYKKDSMIEFCKFIYKKYPWRTFIILFQLFGLLAYLIRIISKKKFKEFFLLYIYGIKPEKLFEQLNYFWEKEFPVNFSKELIDKIAFHNKYDNETVCISASPDLFINLICLKIGIKKIIATKLEYRKYFYFIKGENCRGEEKISRLKKMYNLNQVQIIEAYSDNKDDKKLLSMANPKP